MSITKNHVTVSTYSVVSMSMINNNFKDDLSLTFSILEVFVINCETLTNANKLKLRFYRN